MFKFDNNTDIVDHDIKDERLVIGRVLDWDDNNKPYYVLKSRDGDIDVFSTDYVEAHFIAVEDIE